MARPSKTDSCTRAEAAALLDVNVRTVDRWADEGRFTRYKVGDMQWVRFSRRELTAFKATVSELTPVTPASGISVGASATNQ